MAGESLCAPRRKFAQKSIDLGLKLKKKIVVRLRTAVGSLLGLPRRGTVVARFRAPPPFNCFIFSSEQFQNTQTSYQFETVPEPCMRAAKLLAVLLY